MQKNAEQVWQKVWFQGKTWCQGKIISNQCFLPAERKKQNITRKFAKLAKFAEFLDKMLPNARKKYLRPLLACKLFVGWPELIANYIFQLMYKKKPSLALRAIRSENFAGVLRSQVNSEGQLWGANFALTGGGGPKLPGWAKAPSAHAMHCLSLAHLQHHLAP